LKSIIVLRQSLAPKFKGARDCEGEVKRLEVSAGF
jgi:hypothetical protein